ncbi:MAG: SCO family protein [Alphaproteobacteria bacterium]|nr:SCO family protein [Alphaproteobacteria bacterium]
MNNKLLILLAAVIAFGAYFAQKASHSLSPAPSATAEGEVSTTGNADIGGEFALINQLGEPFTQAHLQNRWSLVFFGFSNCPDMCPTALSTISGAMDIMPEQIAEQITPVFITVDPERDTPEALKDYVTNFHSRMVGLTGSKEATDQAASAFKVYHQVADPAVKDYMVNHSGFIYVMNKNGKYAKHFSHTASPETIATEMQELVK